MFKVDGFARISQYDETFETMWIYKIGRIFAAREKHFNFNCSVNAQNLT